MAENVRVGSAHDLRPGDGIRVEVGGRVLAVFHAGDEYYAIDGICIHRGVSLADGFVNEAERTIACPLHGAQFSLTTGEAITAPAQGRVRTYRVSVKDDELFVEIE